MHEDGGDALLPHEILARILPFAWERLEEARALQLVCRAFHHEADTRAFWAHWLERREARLFTAVQRYDQALLKTLHAFYQRIPTPILVAGGMRAVVQSKMAPGSAPGFATTMRSQLFEGWVDPVSNERNGPCALYFSDGDAFFGSLRDGVFSGTGVYQWQSGMRYEGGFDRQFRAGPVRSCFWASSRHNFTVAPQGRISFLDGSSFESNDFRALFPQDALVASEETGEETDDVYTAAGDPEGSKAEGNRVGRLISSHRLHMRPFRHTSYYDGCGRAERCGVAGDGRVRMEGESVARRCAALSVRVLRARVFLRHVDGARRRRIVAGGTVYGVRTSVGMLERTDMVYRRVAGMWEFAGRFDRH